MYNIGKDKACQGWDDQSSPIRNLPLILYYTYTYIREIRKINRTKSNNKEERHVIINEILDYSRGPMAYSFMDGFSKRRLPVEYVEPSENIFVGVPFYPIKQPGQFWQVDINTLEMDLVNTFEDDLRSAT